MNTAEFLGVITSSAPSRKNNGLIAAQSCLTIDRIRPKGKAGIGNGVNANRSRLHPFVVVTYRKEKSSEGTLQAQWDSSGRRPRVPRGSAGLGLDLSRVPLESNQSAYMILPRVDRIDCRPPTFLSTARSPPARRLVVNVLTRPLEVLLASHDPVKIFLPQKWSGSAQT